MENAVATRAGSGGGVVRGIRVLVVLAALTALGPLSIDAYIPGLPRLADSLHSSAWAVRLTVTACLAGLAIGQLLAGPLSDALGRRGPLLFGLVAAAAVNGALVGRFGAGSLFRAGVTGTMVTSVVLLVFAVAGLGLWPILAALFVAIAQVGLVLPNAPALVLRHRGSNAGAAAALLGCGQFLFGGLAAPLVGLTTAHSAVPMAMVMTALGLAALTVLITVTPAGTAGFPIRTSGDQPYEEIHHDHGHRH